MDVEEPVSTPRRPLGQCPDRPSPRNLTHFGGHHMLIRRPRLSHLGATTLLMASSCISMEYLTTKRPHFTSLRLASGCSQMLLFHPQFQLCISATGRRISQVGPTLRSRTNQSGFESSLRTSALPRSTNSLDLGSYPRLRSVVPTTSATPQSHKLRRSRQSKAVVHSVPAPLVGHHMRQQHARPTLTSHENRAGVLSW